MGRGKSYDQGQQSILEKAFAKKMTPRKILAEHPGQGFTLDGLKGMAKKYTSRATLGRKAGSGSAKKRTARQAKKVKKSLEKNPNVSMRRIASQVGVPLTTVGRIMKEDLEFKTYRTVKAQKLKASSKQQRLEACLKWQSAMDAGDLNPKNIFFTDEKMFVCGADATKGAQNCRVHVHKSIRKEDIPAEYLVRGQGAQQGGVRCMVSAGMSYRGKGSLRIVEPGVKINAETYLEMVKNTYETDMVHIFRPGAEDGHPNYYFQQDNAPAHTAKLVKAYLKDNVPHVLEPWPANSPDLNLLDYSVWGILEKTVGEKMEGKDPTLLNLKVAVQAAYNELDMKTVKKAVKQWRKRVACCVEHHGGHIEQHMGAK